MEIRKRKGTYSFTRLMRASALGRHDVVHTLLQEGRDDVNEQGPRGSTALMFAAGSGHLDIVKELVAYGADVSMTEEGGWCARRHAEEDGYEDIASFLKLIERAKQSNKTA